MRDCGNLRTTSRIPVTKLAPSTSKARRSCELRYGLLRAPEGSIGSGEQADNLFNALADLVVRRGVRHPDPLRLMEGAPGNDGNPRRSRESFGEDGARRLDGLRCSSTANEQVKCAGWMDDFSAGGAKPPEAIVPTPAKCAHHRVPRGLFG